MSRIHLGKKIVLGILLTVTTIMLTHCFGNLKNERDQAAALKRLKRGSLNKDGFYRNEFYEFNLQLPKAWIGSVSDPPTILTALPPEKEILDSNARKFVDIQVQVMMASSDDTIDLMIERYSKANDYELINQKNTKIEKAESRQCVFNGKWKDSPIKVISLVVFRDKKAVIVQCRALRPLYDNVFAHFASCLNSFIVTSSEAASATPTPTPNPFDRNADFIIYAVQSGDTPAGIAERFMGEAERASDILAENKIERFTVGENIKIPRFLKVMIGAEDSYEQLAEKFFSDRACAEWIKTYNTGIEFSSGTVLYIPLYEVEKPLPREEYLELSRRVYERQELVDTLLIYNDGTPLNMLDKVKLPVFLKIADYSVTVQPGDTLAVLAGYYTGETKNYTAIAKYNNISPPYTLSSGQVIKIPRALVKDPSVFKKPRARSKPSQTTKPAGASTPVPASGKPVEKTPIPAATSTPRSPTSEDGIYEPD